MKQTSRIVITGSGVIAGIGAGEAFTKAIYEGATAVRSGPEPNAAIADFTPQTWLGPKGYRYMDRAARMLCVASQLALEDAKWDFSTEAPEAEAPGLIYGSMFSSAQSIIAFDWTAITDGPSMVSPLEFPNTVISSPGGQAAIKYHLSGPNSTVCQGFSSSLHAIGQGLEFLRFGRARRILAGGVEAYGPEISNAMRPLGQLSGSVKPFDPASTGTVPGEGAGLWLLELAEAARARGVVPKVEVLGFGEAQGETADAACYAAAMLQAIRDAGIEAKDIGCIIASANGIAAADQAELAALKTVFGERLSSIVTCAPKASFGEALGASGIFSAMVGASALVAQEVPPTVGAQGNGLSSQKQSFRGDYALVNAFSPDGNAASLVLGLYK